jgi:hypothetical protein
MSEDLFPHATAQAPELERARREVAALEILAEQETSTLGRMMAIDGLIQARRCVYRLEAEVMRKEGQ